MRKEGTLMILKDLSLSYGTQVIFDHINLNIEESEKIGIVGVNGAGKSTLFKILRKEQLPDSGQVIIPKQTRIAWLPQVIDEEIPQTDMPVLDYLESGRPIHLLEQTLEEKYREAATATPKQQTKLLKQIEKIQEQLDYFDHYQAETILLEIIEGMKIDFELLEKPLNKLSGGQKSKVAFAKLLYSKPDLILLDEPTNHLDKGTKEYVIKFIQKYKGSIYIISHDVAFLDQVTTKTLFLDKRTHQMTVYNGNYSYYKKVSQEQEAALEKVVAKQEKEEEKLKAIVLKYSNSSGKRKRMAQSREKALEKLQAEKIERTVSQKSVSLKLTSHQEGSKTPLSIKNLWFRYDQAKPPIIQNFQTDISKNERFLIIGKNGAGKSTLLKLIVGILKPDEGEIRYGAKTEIAYYAQEHEGLDPEKTILDNFDELNVHRNRLRAVLGNFLFFGDDVFKKIKVLSPGERSRVALAKLVLKGANLLVLDEPTNHLDPETQEQIAKTFHDYQGTLIVVSHNLDFVDHIGIDRMLVLPAGQIQFYDRDKVKYYESLKSEK